LDIRITVSIRERVSSLIMENLPFKNRETVVLETPAALAMSPIVTFFLLLSAFFIIYCFLSEKFRFYCEK